MLCSWCSQSVARAGSCEDVSRGQRTWDCQQSQSALSVRQARIQTEQSSQEWRQSVALALVGETPAISGHWEEDRVDACPSHHQHQLHHRLPEGRDQALLVEDRMWRLGSLMRRFWQFDQTINSSHTVYIVVVAFELTRIVNKKVLTRIFWYTFSHLTHY